MLTYFQCMELFLKEGIPPGCHGEVSMRRTLVHNLIVFRVLAIPATEDDSGIFDVTVDALEIWMHGDRTLKIKAAVVQQRFKSEFGLAYA